MGMLDRRLSALEQSGPAAISPRVKAWLGWPLTDAERRAANDDTNVDPDFDAIDTSAWSPEARRWLGVDQ